MRTVWEEETKPEALGSKTKIDNEIERVKKLVIDRDSKKRMLAELYEEMEEVKKKLVLPDIYVDNTGVEKLVTLMEANGGMMSSISTEAGAAIQNLLGRLNNLKRPDDDPFLNTAIP